MLHVAIPMQIPQPDSARHRMAGRPQLGEDPNDPSEISYCSKAQQILEQCRRSVPTEVAASGSRNGVGIAGMVDMHKRVLFLMGTLLVWFTSSSPLHSQAAAAPKAAKTLKAKTAVPVPDLSALWGPRDTSKRSPDEARLTWDPFDPR